MHLLEIARLDARAADEFRRLRRRRRRAVELRRTAARPRRRPPDARPRRPPRPPCRARDSCAPDRRAGGARRTSARVSGVPRIERPIGWSGNAMRLQIFEHQVVGRVLGGADLLHDDVLLALKLLRIEGRIGEDVGEHVERERHVGAQHARVIGGGLDAGRGVEIAADRLDLLGDLARGAALGALERHVLEEMRNAVLVRRARRGCRSRPRRRARRFADAASRR